MTQPASRPKPSVSSPLAGVVALIVMVSLLPVPIILWAAATLLAQAAW